MLLYRECMAGGNFGRAKAGDAGSRGKGADYKKRRPLGRHHLPHPGTDQAREGVFVAFF